MENNQKFTVGFIGTGVMGKSMARHILKAGYKLVVYNRSREKAGDLLEEGAAWAEIAELAAACNVIITMVGYPNDVEQLYFGGAGIIANAQKGSYLVDMTTSSPRLAAKIYESAKAKGIFALDAPVSGGDVGAREARLAIMAGGDNDAFETILPIFQLLGKNIQLLGPAGSGQHTKMCNQILIASNLKGVCEALIYAKGARLDPLMVIKAIESGAAGSWQLSNLGPRMLGGDFAPGFFIKHFIKDLKIAMEAAQEMQLKTPSLEQTLQLFEKLAGEGEGNSGTQALFKLYDQTKIIK